MLIAGGVDNAAVMWLALVWCRGYPEAKVRQNVSCEIMQVIVDEAREGYK